MVFPVRVSLQTESRKAPRSNGRSGAGRPGQKKTFKSSLGAKRKKGKARGAGSRNEVGKTQWGKVERGVGLVDGGPNNC